MRLASAKAASYSDWCDTPVRFVETDLFAVLTEQHTHLAPSNAGPLMSSWNQEGPRAPLGSYARPSSRTASEFKNKDKECHLQKNLMGQFTSPGALQISQNRAQTAQRWTSPEGIRAESLHNRNQPQHPVHKALGSPPRPHRQPRTVLHNENPAAATCPNTRYKTNKSLHLMTNRLRSAKSPRLVTPPQIRAQFRLPSPKIGSVPQNPPHPSTNPPLATS